MAATRSAVLGFLAATWAGGQQGEPVTFVLVDLDALLKVNRRCGHDLGDTVLLLASNRIHHVARRALAPYAFAADGTVRDPAVARFGDDEFLVVLPGVPTSAAAPTAAAIVAAIASDPFIVFDSTAGNRLEVSRYRCGGRRGRRDLSARTGCGHRGPARHRHHRRRRRHDRAPAWVELLVAAYGVLHTAKTSARGPPAPSRWSDGSAPQARSVTDERLPGMVARQASTSQLPSSAASRTQSSSARTAVTNPGPTRA
ncbi:MAG: diguanylate cyclase domain-containing protein [Acidimicrobiia bacterium]